MTNYEKFDKNCFYLFKTEDKFIKIDKNEKWSEGEDMFNIYTTKIDYASFWSDKKTAKGWKNMIKNEFPDVKLIEANLIEKIDKK